MFVSSFVIREASDFWDAGRVVVVVETVALSGVRDRYAKRVWVTTRALHLGMQRGKQNTVEWYQMTGWELGLLCPGADGTLLSSSPGVNPTMIDLTALQDFKCYSAATKFFNDAGVGVGVVKHEPGVTPAPGYTGRGPPPPSPPHAPHSLPRLPWLRSQHRRATPHRHVALLNDVTGTTTF
uniref:Uncharacterized protein n=1 Tax=Timema genevievae TaxID=629358 RepID=A0A7R9JQR4_TIMGE|nr:unnamed protein product [Timema genevievae]